MEIGDLDDGLLDNFLIGPNRMLASFRVLGTTAGVDVSSQDTKLQLFDPLWHAVKDLLLRRILLIVHRDRGMAQKRSELSSKHAHSGRPGQVVMRCAIGSYSGIGLCHEACKTSHVCEGKWHSIEWFRYDGLRVQAIIVARLTSNYFLLGQNKSTRTSFQMRAKCNVLDGHAGPWGTLHDPRDSAPIGPCICTGSQLAGWLREVPE